MLRELWGGPWVAGWEVYLKRIGEELDTVGEPYWWGNCWEKYEAKQWDASADSG